MVIYFLIPIPPCQVPSFCLLIPFVHVTKNIYLQPFTNDFPRANIHELLLPDLLHQLIKGTFKDHLVTWIEEYLNAAHGPAHANIILDDIDKQWDTLALCYIKFSNLLF